MRNRTTRSLSIGEREKIATIAKDKPSIDLEINFEFNSDRIGRAAASTVEALGKALTDPALKGNTFILAGHTDGKGQAGLTIRSSRSGAPTRSSATLSRNSEWLRHLW